MTFAEFTATRKHVDDVGTAVGLPDMFDKPQPGFVYDNTFFICDPCEATGDQYWSTIGAEHHEGALDVVERALYAFAAKASAWPTPLDEYSERVAAAAKEQGVDLVIEELARRGIDATLEQTGGMTMAFGIRVDGVYISGNAWSAAAFLNEQCIPEEMLVGICAYDEAGGGRSGVAESVAEDVAAWVAKRIALHFSERLREEIGEEDIKEVVRRNGTEEYIGLCASHDYCDANMTMLDAFRDAGLHSMMTPFSDDQQRLWGRVWLAWRAGATSKNGGAA